MPTCVVCACEIYAIVMIMIAFLLVLAHFSYACYCFVPAQGGFMARSHSRRLMGLEGKGGDAKKEGEVCDECPSKHCLIDPFCNKLFGYLPGGIK